MKLDSGSVEVSRKERKIHATLRKAILRLINGAHPEMVILHDPPEADKSLHYTKKLILGIST